MSYTSFSYAGFKAEWEEDLPAVSFTVTNTGGRKGWVVPMLFIRWVRGTIIPRSKELKQFVKILLESEESKYISLRLAEKIFSVGIMK
jgi:beta-glucosidase